MFLKRPFTPLCLALSAAIGAAFFVSATGPSIAGAGAGAARKPDTSPVERSLSSLRSESEKTAATAPDFGKGADLNLNPGYFNVNELSLVHQYLRAGEYMPESEIKPGMEGYGLTVFHGTKIERFNVRVIGTVRKVLNNRDAILVRLYGPTMDKSKVIKGMSGSPVYIGGKLIGAISYGFDFSLEPIAGVTPIVDMLDALAQDTGKEREPDRISKAQLPVVPASVVATAFGAMPTSASSASPHMVPLMAPVSLAGFSPRAERFLSSQFESLGLYASSGASGGLDPSLLAFSDEKRVDHAASKHGAGAHSASQAKSSSKQAIGSHSHSHNMMEPVRPGSPVAVMLTTGDFNSSACGTCTGVFKDRVLAFGHPFLQAGAVDFPLASAYIHQVMPSLAVSFKVSSPMAILGSVVSDRPWAIGGLIGKQSKLIPATFEVIDETRHLEHTFKVGIVDHPDLTPMLTAATAMSAIDATHQSSAPYILKVKSTIETTNAGSIVRTDLFPTNFAAHSPRDPSGSGNKMLRTIMGDPLGGYLQGVLTRILDNQFEKSGIKSVRMRISLEDGQKAAKLERIYVDKSKYQPGDRVTVHCQLRPYNQPPVVKSLLLTIPRDVPDGDLLIGVSSGDEIDSLRKHLGLVDPQPVNLSQVVGKIRDSGRGDTLTAVMALPQQSVSVNGVTIINPPPQWSKILFSNRYTHGPVLTRGEIKATQAQDFLIDGSHVMTVTVESEEKALARAKPVSVQADTTAPLDGIVFTEQARKSLHAINDTGTVHTLTAAATGASTAAASSAGSDTKHAKARPVYFTAPKGYPHTRAMLMWRQDSEADFRQGAPHHTTIDSWGRMAPAFTEVASASLPEDMQIWASTYSDADGCFYFTTADKIYSWHGDDQPPHLVATLNSSIVSSLACNSKGVLYAAIVPTGEVVEIEASKGTASKQSGSKASLRTIYKSPQPTITALAANDNDELFVAVSGEGKVYKLKPNQNGSFASSTLFDSGQAHATCLFYSPGDKKLYVGTGERGCVYSVDRDGHVKAEYEAADHVVTGVAKDREGNLYVATAFQGHLLKVSTTGETKTLADSEAFYTLFYDRKNDQVYSGDAEGDITQLQVDPLSKQAYFLPVSHTEQEAVLSLCTDSDGRLFAGTSNLASARLFKTGPAEDATYLSTVHDALRPARWSRLRAYGAHNEVMAELARGLKIETRTGETERPDVSWSAFEEAPFADGAFIIKSGTGRFLQYKVRWPGAATERPVTVGRVEVTYLPKDLPPQFSTVSLAAGTCVSGKQEISVAAVDQDGDNMLLSLELTSDGGKTWQAVAKDLRAKNAKAQADGATKPAAATASSSAPAQANSANQDSEAEAKGGAGSGKEQEGAAGAESDAQASQGADGEKGSGDESGSGSETNSKNEKQTSAFGSGQPLELSTPESPDESASAPSRPKSGTKAKARAKRAPKTDEHRKQLKKASAAKKGAKKSKEAAGKKDLHTEAKQESSQPEQFAFQWDTSKIKDGGYIMRLSLDDRISNGDGGQTSALFRSVEVDNSAPEVQSVKFERIGKNRGKITVQAKDNQTAITNATYRFDDGEPMALTGAEGVSDGLSVIMVADDVSLDHSVHKLEIQVTDRAGNTATKCTSVK